MTEETFGPTLPVMRVADAEEAVALANDGPYGLQASVWTRDEDRGEEIARRIEAGVGVVNDAQLNYAALELPMGGWKSSGLGSRHGPDGIRKYTKRQSLMVTPGTAPSRDAHHFPYSAAVSQAIGESFAALATSDLFDDAQRATLSALCDTFIPSLEPPEGDEAQRGFWRARGIATWRFPRGSRSRSARRGSPRSSVVGLRALLDSLAENGMVAATPQEAREQIVHGFCDQSPEALAGISTLRAIAGTIFYALPDLGTGRNPNWDAIGFPGPIGRAAGRPRAPAARAPPSRPRGDDRGRRLHRRLRRGRRRDRRRAGRRRASRSSCSRRATTTTTPTSTGSSSPAYQRMYLNGGPFPTAEGQVSIVAGTGRRAAAR